MRAANMGGIGQQGVRDGGGAEPKSAWYGVGKATRASGTQQSISNSASVKKWGKRKGEREKKKGRGKRGEGKGGTQGYRGTSSKSPPLSNHSELSHSSCLQIKAEMWRTLPETAGPCRTGTPLLPAHSHMEKSSVKGGLFPVFTRHELPATSMNSSSARPPRQEIK